MHFIVHGFSYTGVAASMYFVIPFANYYGRNCYHELAL
jgi:hypothetical protein